jgi:hypothetical protein
MEVIAMLPSPSDHSYEARRLEYELDVSQAAFTQAFKSLLGRMNFDAPNSLALRDPRWGGVATGEALAALLPFSS